MNAAFLSAPFTKKTNKKVENEKQAKMSMNHESRLKTGGYRTTACQLMSDFWPQTRRRL